MEENKSMIIEAKFTVAGMTRGKRYDVIDLINSGITIKEITMDMLDKEAFAGYLPWNIRFGTNSSIRAMQKMMEERK